MRSQSICHCLLIIGWVGAAMAEDRDPKSAISTATQVAESIRAGQFEKTVSYFDPKLRSALTAGALRVAAGQIRDLGDVVRSDDPMVSETEDHTVVALREHRVKGSVELRVTIDEAGEVAGLHYLPVSGSTGEP